MCVVVVIAGLGIDALDPFPDDRRLIQISPQAFPSTRAVPPADVAEGGEVLSLTIDRDALTHPERGLLTHPEARGRQWERPGYVSYFTDGRLRLATRTGVRLHGGRSRVYSPVKSFRFHFRPKYGPPAVPASIFFGESATDDLRTVIAHNDVRSDRSGRNWHLVNPLAYDIAERLGGIVPRTRPVRFYLNGEPNGLYVVTEHVGPEFLEARFGHREFLIDAVFSRRNLQRWARTTTPFAMRDVAVAVDLDNLTSWALTVLFCATTDVLSQGPLARDLRDPAGRWFWITWDLDHSFMDLNQRATEPWRLDSYGTLLGKEEGRSHILTRLLRTDPDYRRYFATRLAKALNHQLTPEFLRNRFGFYWEIAMRGGITDDSYLAILQRFLAERPRVLWRLSAEHLQTGAPLTVSVDGPPGATVEIDGFKTVLPYTGTYLPRTPFVLDGGPAVRGWAVNGRAYGAQVSLDVAENLVIRPADHIGEQSHR